MVGLQWLILLDQLVMIGLLILVLTTLWHISRGMKK